MAPRNELNDRIRGALVGVAVGDALGAPFEGRAPLWDQELGHVLDRLLQLDIGPLLGLGAIAIEELRFTDDTHMTIGLAESLSERGGFDGEHLARTFGRFYEDEPWRGYGATPPAIFALHKLGISWDRAASLAFEGEGSFGNGAAMRVAPAAIAGRGDLDRVAHLARQTAQITHTHPLGIEGAVIQAVAVALALAASDLQSPFQFVEQLRPFATNGPFQRKLHRLGELLADPVSVYDVVVHLGNGIEAADSVPAAIWAFLRSGGSFPETISRSIYLGGDTDTIAAMAGALAGAYRGEQAIPAIWRERVEGVERLGLLAEQLLAAFPKDRNAQRTPV